MFQNSTYRNTTGTNTATTPKLDPTNWVLQGIEGALLDITNSIYIDNIVFDMSGESETIKLRNLINVRFFEFNWWSPGLDSLLLEPSTYKVRERLKILPKIKKDTRIYMPLKVKFI